MYNMGNKKQEIFKQQGFGFTQTDFRTGNRVRIGKTPEQLEQKVDIPVKPDSDPEQPVKVKKQPKINYDVFRYLCKNTYPGIADCVHGPHKQDYTDIERQILEQSGYPYLIGPGNTRMPIRSPQARRFIDPTFKKVYNQAFKK